MRMTNLFHAGSFPKLAPLAVGAVVLCLQTFLPSTQAASAPLTFEKDIRPIFKTHCFQCHGEGEKLKGGLDVRLVRLTVKGGESGPAIVPGKHGESPLYDLIHKGDMPKGAKKLPASDIDKIARWIDQGAKTARPEPASLAGFHITDEEKNFWAFQPIVNPPVPKVRGGDKVIRNSIDAFLLAKLKEKKLAFAPEADRATLIRRATFDLTGLPPTPEEVRNFLEDKSPDAFEKVVDRLLESPAHGEAWARHWLDVAGYADSDGFTEQDPVRKYAYKYRDYVIRSLNADKPFDQFICEQLAGDEMVPQPYKNLSPDSIDKLIATGFLRMAPDGTSSGGVDQTVARNQVMADTIKIVSTSLMGLTVGCAQCHDHRHDPISQEDYYRMRAVFEPALDWKNWRVPNARLISLMTDAERAKAAEIEKEAAKLDAARNKKQQEFIDEILEVELAKRPEALRKTLREAYKTEVKKRTPEQVKLLKEHPRVAQLSPGSLYLYKQKMADELKAMSDEAAKVRSAKPVEEFVAALTEPAHAKLPVTYLFNRGEPDQPKQALLPRELTVLEDVHPVRLEEKSAKVPTSGRRLAFARSLTDGKHPLTARVMVNRVWMLHFGRGIVASPGDFGLHGDRPSHPELLDWLATNFMEQGWSLKKLHRLMMTSTAYRQSSQRDSKKELIDPDNRLVARMNVRRLEAETLRDSMLALSGRLNPTMLGQPVPIMEDESGQVVVGVDTTDTAGRPSGKYVSLKGDEYRRSLYVQVRRSKPLGMLETFDAPAMEPNCDARNASTVAPQSLALMNGDFAVAQSMAFADRIAKEAGSSAEDQIKRAWLLAFGKEPAVNELMAAGQFLSTQTEQFKTDPPKLPPPPGSKTAPKIDPAHLALATYCQALLASNRFLYVD